MMSDEQFFNRFLDRIIGPDLPGDFEEPEGENNVAVGDDERKAVVNDDDGNASRSVRFLMHQLRMIPKTHHPLFWNLLRKYPTAPIWMFLGIGMLATNIARYSAVRRLGSDGSNVERTGAFYNLIAPSRFGKGIAISLVTELGSYIEKLRTDNFNDYVRVQQEQLGDPSARQV